MTEMNPKTKSKQPKERLKIIIKSTDPCSGCDKVRQDAEELATELGEGVSLEVIEVKLDSKAPDPEPEAVTAFFGKESELKVPVVIVESACKSRKLPAGYSKGDLKRMVEEVRCRAEEGKASSG